MKCTQRLYLTADRKALVPHGHKKAATLYAIPGDEIPERPTITSAWSTAT
jgi:hypothetical protein